jgi:UDP-glucose-4-epimerase GalE
MRVLVTGGAGYVGSHCARALARRGHTVVLYDNLSRGFRALAHGLNLIVGDIGDYDAVSTTLQGVDAVIHFAAHAYVGESVQSPRKYFQNNVRSALTLLNAAVDCNVRKFVFSSTCAVYGVPDQVPISEQCVPNPINAYGVTKLLFERALESYDTAYGMRFAALRYFNAAGADESGEIGEMHDPETHLIPLVLQAAAGRREHIDVFGNDYPTPDGTCVRDYVHVSDLAEAHSLALDYLQDHGSSVTLNLGTGYGHSVTNIIDAVERTTGRKIKRNYAPRRPGDAAVLVADPRRAKSVLGWTATRELEDIIVTAWTWTQKQLQKPMFTPDDPVENHPHVGT